jgi:Putative bacterial sensory transduction regulator
MDTQSVEKVIEDALRDAGIEFERPEPAVFVAALPGERRLKTACWLTIGEHALTVEAFVMRHPEENHEQVYAYLLRHSARMYAVSWSIDDKGDVYLTGHVSLASITPAEIDRILGAVLEYADGAFNALLQLGFGSSIKREWQWRVKRGEPLANLAAFSEFAQRDI